VAGSVAAVERQLGGAVVAADQQPAVTWPTDGRKTPALRFGDPRVMALAGALCQTLLAATGFTNKHLRVLMTGLLGGATRRPDDLRPYLAGHLHRDAELVPHDHLQESGRFLHDGT
jgi:hypothetical protein